MVSRAERQPPVKGQRFPVRIEEMEGMVHLDSVCSTRWVFKGVSLEDCNFLPGNSGLRSDLRF